MKADLLCPSCNHFGSTVINSRGRARNYICRRRECQLCGYRFTTEERVAGPVAVDESGIIKKFLQKALAAIESEVK